MYEVWVLVACWAGQGVLCASGYWSLWRCRPKLRHVAAWPVLLGSMFWAETPPAWMAPAPRQLEAQQVLDRYRPDPQRR